MKDSISYRTVSIKRPDYDLGPNETNLRRFLQGFLIIWFHATVANPYFLTLNTLEWISSLKSNLKSQINADSQRDSCKFLFIVLSLLNDLILIFAKNLY